MSWVMPSRLMICSSIRMHKIQQTHSAAHACVMLHAYVCMHTSALDTSLPVQMDKVKYHSKSQEAMIYHLTALAAVASGVSLTKGRQTAGASRHLLKGDSQFKRQAHCPLKSHADRQVLQRHSWDLLAGCMTKVLRLSRLSREKPCLGDCTIRSSTPSRASGKGSRSIIRQSKPD